MKLSVPPETEAPRIATGGCGDAPPPGMSLFAIDAVAESAAAEVLDRAREVMRGVLETLLRDTPEDRGPASAIRHLPRWFVDASGPDQTPEDARDWLRQLERMPPDERAEAEAAQRWSVSDFMYWLEPDQREWWWWGAELLDADNLRICLAVQEPSFPHEALDWLLRASGASKVVDENVRDLS